MGLSLSSAWRTVQKAQILMKLFEGCVREVCVWVFATSESVCVCVPCVLPAGRVLRPSVLAPTESWGETGKMGLPWGPRGGSKNACYSKTCTWCQDNGVRSWRNAEKCSYSASKLSAYAKLPPDSWCEHTGPFSSEHRACWWIRMSFKRGLKFSPIYL